MKEFLQSLTTPFLITTDGWFIAPDGKQYRAAWGVVKVCTDEETLGIKTNRYSTNWYVKVGDDVKGMIIAGCQIKYVVICLTHPYTKPVQEKKTIGNTFEVVVVDNPIYLAQ